jgi:ribonuclease P protein component
VPGSSRRALRLRDHAAFVVTQKTGRRVGSTHMTLIGKSNTLGHDRLGIIASRKLGGAVVRNRAKRRIRELFRLAAPSAETAGFDLVVIPRTSLLTEPFGALEADYRSALRRLRGGK